MALLIQRSVRGHSLAFEKTFLGLFSSRYLLLYEKVGGLCKEIFSRACTFELSQVCKHDLDDPLKKVVCRARQWTEWELWGGEIGSSTPASRSPIIAEVFGKLFSSVRKQERGDWRNARIASKELFDALPELGLGVVTLHRRVENVGQKGVQESQIRYRGSVWPCSLVLYTVSKVNRTVMTEKAWMKSNKTSCQTFLDEMKISSQYPCFPSPYIAFFYGQMCENPTRNCD